MIFWWEEGGICGLPPRCHQSSPLPKCCPLCHTREHLGAGEAPCLVGLSFSPPSGLWRGRGGAFTDQPSSWRWSSSPLLGRMELLATARAAASTVRSLRDPHRKDFLFPSAQMAHFGTSRIGKREPDEKIPFPSLSKNSTERSS